MHDGVDDHRHGSVQVGIGKDDLGAFAAQLQRHRAVPLGGHLLDLRANFGAAREADVGNARVAGQRVAHFVAVAGDDVERARRKPHFGRQLCHADQAQARVFSGLDHAHIARRQSAAHAAAKNLHGVVPRNDVARHAMGLAPGQHAVAVGVRNGLAVQLVAGARIKLEVARQRQRIGPRLSGGLAAVAPLQGGQLVGVLQNFCRELLQQAAPVGRRHLLPHGVVALARGMHGGIDVVGRAALDLVKRLAVGRVDHRDGAAGGGRNGGVGDEVQLHGQIVRQKQCVLMVFRSKWPIALMY